MADDVHDMLVGLRLAQADVDHAIIDVAVRASDLDARLRTAFVAAAQAGYRWAAAAGAYAPLLDEQSREALRALAEAYARNRDARGRVLAEAALLLRGRRLIIDGEATPYASADAAFDGVGAIALDLLGFGPDAGRDELRAAFHLGGALFAAETALAEELNWQERIEQVRRAQRRDRVRKLLRFGR